MSNEEIARGTVILEVELSQAQIDAKIDALADRITNTLIKAATIAGNAISGIGGALRGAANILGSVFQGAAKLAIGAFQLLGKAAGAVLGQLANVAKVGALALAALGGTAIVAGGNFNILQQTVRGALIAILQSEEAALKLLAAVNELNDSSPFARSVFLQLTQTLAGFGVEAEKIPGVLDAIQQAVAATGGGEDDLLALGQAIARVASEGRLTGDVLQSFAARGINVLELLGEAAGKTGQQIREDISNGAIGATEAIDTLTVALTERFAGATEAVSKNFPGALDRINARIRDMGAALTKVFINPIGGGALVDTMNDISTSISAVTKIIVPLLIPAIQKLADLMNAVSERVRVFAERFTLTADGSKRTATELTKVTTALGQFLEPMKSLLPLMAGLVGFFPLLLRDLPIVGNLLSGLGGPVTAIIAALATIPEVRKAFMAFAESLRPLVSGLLPQFTAFMATLTTAIIPIVTALFNALGQVIGVLATTVFPALLTAINTIVSALGPILTPVFQTLADVIIVLATTVLPALLQGMTAFITGIGPGLGELVRQIADAFILLAPVITAVVTTALPPLIAAFNQIVTALGPKLGPLFQMFADALISLAESALPAFIVLIGEIVSTLGPTLVDIFTELGPLLIEIGPTLAELFVALSPVVNSLNELLIAILPFIPPLVVLLTEGLKELSLQFLAVSEDISTILDFFTSLIGDIKTLGQNISNALNVISNGLDAVDTSLSNVLTKIPLLGGFFKKTEEPVKATKKALDGATTSVSSFGTYVSRAVKPVSNLGTGLAKIPAVITSAVNPALKAAKDSVRTLADQIKTSLDGLTSKFSEVFAAAANLTSAQKALTGAHNQLAAATNGVAVAHEKLAAATQTVLDLEASRAQIIAKTITPLQEIQIAEEALAKGRANLRDIDQDIIATQERLNELRTPASAEDLAAADRDITRANISLNDALREQAELRAELNTAQEESVDLAGLSLDQLKSQSANARASAAAQRAATKKTGKTQQELADDLLIADMNVADAKVVVNEALAAKVVLDNQVLNNAIAIREEEEKLEGLAITKTEAARTQNTLQTSLNTLVAGETTLAAALLVLDGQITVAKQEEQTAAEGITLAKQAEQTAAEAIAVAAAAVLTANLENKLATAIILGDAQGILTAQIDLLTEKAKQPGVSDLVLAKLREELGVIQNQREEVRGLEGELRRVSAIKPISATAGGGNIPLGPALPPLFDSQGGGDFGNQIIHLIGKALIEKGFLARYSTPGGRGAFAEGGLITSPTNALMGEGYKSELILPLSKPDRVWQLLSQHLPRYPGALAAAQTAILPSGTGVALPKLNLSGAKTTRSYLDEPLSERTGRRIADLLEKGNLGSVSVEAPITLSNPVEDPELTARLLKRQIQRTINRRR